MSHSVSWGYRILFQTYPSLGNTIKKILKEFNFIFFGGSGFSFCFMQSWKNFLNFYICHFYELCDIYNYSNEEINNSKNSYIALTERIRIQLESIWWFLIKIIIPVNCSKTHHFNNCDENNNWCINCLNFTPNLIAIMMLQILLLFFIAHHPTDNKFNYRVGYTDLKKDEIQNNNNKGTKKLK